MSGCSLKSDSVTSKFAWVTLFPRGARVPFLEDEAQMRKLKRNQFLRRKNTEYQVALWGWVWLAWGQFRGCQGCLSHKVHSGSQATPRINKNSLYLGRVWLTAVVSFGLDWAWNVLVSSPELRPICTTSKRQGKQLLFRLSKIYFSGRHGKNSMTPHRPGVNPNTGDPFNIQKGSLLWNVMTP